MCIDIKTEAPITFHAARNHPLFRRNGKPLSPSTLWRWTRKGCRAADGHLVRLETFRAGGGAMTTVEAVERFVRELTRRSEPPPAVRDDSSPSTEQDQQLIEAGLLKDKPSR